MKPRNFLRSGVTAGLAAVLSLTALQGQYADPSRVVAVAVPDEVPLAVVSTEFADSEIRPRGGALVIGLDGQVRLRNTGAGRIRGITVAVSAAEAAFGGRAVVALSSLNVPPGEIFFLKLNLRLLRPLPAPAGAVVRATVDGVLYDNLTFAGPNRLDSERKMTVRELEARRDREHFRAILEAAGKAGVMQAMQSSLRQQAERPTLAARLAGRSGAAIAVAAKPRKLELAMVGPAHAPLLLDRGSVLVTGAHADAPVFRLLNRADRPLRSFELGWLIRDEDGILYSAGSVPMDAARPLAAGAAFSSAAKQRFAFRPTRYGSAIEGMSVYVRHAQFSDGRIWIPSRSDLEAAALLAVVPVSAEEQRLTGIYRERGAAAVAEELRKFE